MAKRTQYYGIKFPFTENGNDGFFVDLNKKPEDKVASEILHVILTTKGTRIRKPEFGTRLVDFIFGQNDELTWSAIENEVKMSVQKYVSNTVLNQISIFRDENDDNSIYLDLRYSVTYGSTVENNRMVVKL